jgi:geranylgeranyl reductase family protein
MTATCDLAVIGGGPAGSTAAREAALGGAGRVVLIERLKPGRVKICAGGLSPGAIRELKRTGLWDRIRDCSYPIRGMRLTAPNGSRAALSGGEARVLPRDRFDRILLAAAAEAGVDVQTGVTARRIVPDDNGSAWVETDAGRIRARWVVAADGARNRFNRDARPPRRIRAGMVRYEGVEFEPGTVELIYDRRLVPGYLWLFPEAPDQANIGFMLPPCRRHVDSLRDLGRSLLADHFGARLSPAKQRGGWTLFPVMTSRRVAHAAPPRTLLAGEAARLVSPATGEGIYYALRSGRIAASCLADADRAGLDAEAARRLYTRRLRRAFRRSLFLGHAFTRVTTVFLNAGVPVLGSRAVRWTLATLYERL